MTFDIKKYRPSFLQGKIETDEKPRLCLLCPTKLAPNVKWYCSGVCMAEARATGLYGRETEKS